MRELVWEWLLADGSKVRATLNHPRDEESVWVGKRLVSRAVIGTKPEGHRITSSPYRDLDARVTFDADAEVADRRCVLRRGNEVVAPYIWPGRARERLRRAIVVAAPIALAAGCVACGLAAVGLLAGTRLATREIDEVGAPMSEAKVVGTSTAPPPRVAPVGVFARANAKRSPPTTAPLTYDPFTASPRPPHRPSFRPAPRPVSSPAPSPATIDVVCDEQGACQGVKPVRLSLRR